ncbi:MAG: hypothetical protein KGS72_26660 [Cyanobacteria bacterium REEB67]|nr:hypothetical protein [Cyanobacteria bacterium REEB67]
MSDRTKLLRKAVLTGVGATANVDRVRDALNEAMQDLVKVGRDLFDDLEEKGKVKSETVDSFIKGLQEEAAKRTGGFESKVSAKVGKNVKKAAKDFGLVTVEQYESLLARVESLEAHNGITPPQAEAEEAVEENHENGDSEPASKKKKKKGSEE